MVHTLDLFKNQYCEFLNPDTGEPCGVADYAWTAGICIDLVFSGLFGIDYDAGTGKITLDPALPACWNGRILSIENLPLPDGAALSVSVQCGGKPVIAAKITAADGTVKTNTAEGKCVLPIGPEMT